MNDANKIESIYNSTVKSTVVLIVLLFVSTIYLYGNTQGKPRPRVIITTDGEVDDQSSFVRFLLYTNDFDVEGIVATNSKWQRNGHGTQWILNSIDLYNKVRPNLLLHSSDYPTSEYLKSKVVLGDQDILNLEKYPPYKDTPGSDLILKQLLNDDTRDLHIACWGGVNTVAQSLWKLKNNYSKAIYQKAIKKVRIYAIDFQDNGGSWIVSCIQDAIIIKSACWYRTFGYRPQDKNPHVEFMSENWLDNNIKTNHGELGASYPQNYISEGDSPSFFNLIDNGLCAYEDYTLGGWGGRFINTSYNYYVDASENGNIKTPFTRWIVDIQNDFEARMDWCVKSYTEANHQPIIKTVNVSKAIVKAGDRVVLETSVFDSDNDEIIYKWTCYNKECDAELKIKNDTTSKASFIVPENTNGVIQILLEISDNGSPILKTYKRILIRIE